MNKTQKLISENPFYNQRGLLELLNSSKMSISSLLSRVWNEIKDNLMLKQLFHIICFELFSISNRAHNIYNGVKVDNGGQSLNEKYIEYAKFLLVNSPNQFIKFLPLFVEFVGWRELLTYSIKTQKKSKKIVGDFGLLKLIMNNDAVYQALLNFIVYNLKSGSEFNKHQIFKFLHKPNFSVRKTKEGEKRKLQEVTYVKMKVFERIISDLSERMNWIVIVKDKYRNYIGFKEAKRPYQSDLVDFLFTTGEIMNFDEYQFKKLFSTFPSGARHKVRRLVFNHEDKLRNEKYSKFFKWIQEIELSKEQAQQEQRTLENKARTVELSYEEKVKLEKVTKEAKVTIGAASLKEYFEDILIKGKIDKLALETLVNSITFNVNVLPLIDISGSMSGLPNKFSQLALALILNKNKGKFNLFGTFESTAKLYSDGVNEVNGSANKYLVANPIKVSEPIYNRERSFYDNFLNLGKYLTTKGSTNVSGLAEKFKQWVDVSDDEIVKSQKIEEICNFPVILIVSDSEFNNAASAERSFTDFQSKMRNWFGWEGVVVIWSVPHAANNNIMKFDNVNNLYFTNGFNLASIDQVFSKLNDLDVIDSYIGLKSLFNSTRFNIIKEYVI